MRQRNETDQPAQQEQQPAGQQYEQYGYQTPVTPVPAPAKKRSPLRTPLYVVVTAIVFFVIGHAGSSTKTTPAATGAVTTTAPAASTGAKPTATHAAAAPKSNVVLKITGEGEKSTQNFTTGPEWAVGYTFNCANFGQAGNFSITENGGSQDGLPIVDGLAKKGADTTYQHSDPGTHALSVDSECNWTITVTNGS